MPIARKYAAVVPRYPAKPSLIGLILEKIGEAGEILLYSFFPAKYPEARLWREILGLDGSYEFRRSTFSSLLSKLKSQGLVEKNRKGKLQYWRLTSRGRTALRDQKAMLPVKDGKERLICFDIPERERAKRRWLRGELLALGYRPLQKSVWIGETPLPLEFIEALDTLELRDFVHILRVETKGTLER